VVAVVAVVGNSFQQADDPAIALGSELLQAHLLLLDNALVSLGVRDATQLSVKTVRPGVVGTGESIGLSCALLAEAGATVAAPIDQSVKRPLAVPGDDDRVPTDVSRFEAAGTGKLALMGDSDPGVLEDVLHLKFEDLRGGIDPCGHTVILNKACWIYVVNGL
jgi:hypothetical protein